jgi:8-amino-7-oxononanoate synthase
VFSANDYLGLSVHPAVREAAAEAARRLGVGSTGSRHLSGSHQGIIELEASLAQFEKCPTATIAPSGYAANMATLAALGGRDAVIFSDQLNHASLIDGCRASGSRVEVFRHRDLDDLARRLRRCDQRPVIVSDAVFSTEATRADAGALLELAHRHDAWLVLDEAHATGVLGPGGRGAAADAGIAPDEQLVRVVTFSKALGCAGAAVCGSGVVRQLLLQRGRPLIFSTALPHPIVHATLAALRVLQDEPRWLEQLRANTVVLHASLDAHATPSPDQALPMVAITLGQARQAVAVETALWEAGFMVHALRPPTVPAGTSRLRVVVSALHTGDEVRSLAAAMNTRLA